MLSPALFMGIKTVWVGFNIALLWRFRNSTLIKLTYIPLAIYAMLIVYEVSCFILLHTL